MKATDSLMKLKRRFAFGRSKLAVRTFPIYIKSWNSLEKSRVERARAFQQWTNKNFALNTLPNIQLFMVLLWKQISGWQDFLTK